MDGERAEVRRRHRLLAGGWTDEELGRKRRSGELVRLGRGV
jgi:hypothetical protein